MAKKHPMLARHTAQFYLFTNPKATKRPLLLILSTRALCQGMFLPPELFARTSAEERHSPNKPPLVAIILSIFVAVLMMLTPFFYSNRGLRRCFRTRASSPPRDRIVCLTPEALELMPVTKYRATRGGKRDRALKKGGNHIVSSVERAQGCSICTEDFSDGAHLRSLPCGHVFHSDCIDPWLLERSVTCPLCRLNAAAGLASTASGLPARPRRVLFLTELWAQRRNGPRVKLPGSPPPSLSPRTSIRRDRARRSHRRPFAVILARCRRLQKSWGRWARQDSSWCNWRARWEGGEYGWTSGWSEDMDEIK
ncbi:hypothetical protein FDECE_11666 [Fusarium decemcellulare]|nr:hypothetical protein FDECE_11666 [Fusarium decemcellulare]